jgi:hypothetical protein
MKVSRDARMDLLTVEEQAGQRASPSPERSRCWIGPPQRRRGTNWGGEERRGVGRRKENPFPAAEPGEETKDVVRSRGVNATSTFAEVQHSGRQSKRPTTRRWFYAYSTSNC